MKVEIWSDFVCPFCYIGKRKFELALEQFPHKEAIETIFKSFELDPHADSAVRVSTHEMLASKYGMSLEQAKETGAGVAGQAEAVGLTFSFAGMMVENTFDAHRLTHYAATKGKSRELAERLFKAYFTDNDAIADSARLAELAAEVGLDAGEALAVLSSGQYADAVRSDEEEASRLGVRGVPYFVIDRKYAVSGAQSPDVFLNALTKAWEEKHPAFTVVQGDNDDGLCEGDSCVTGSGSKT